MLQKIRLCKYCNGSLPPEKGLQAEYCSRRCRDKAYYVKNPAKFAARRVSQRRRERNVFGTAEFACMKCDLVFTAPTLIGARSKAAAHMNKDHDGFKYRSGNKKMWDNRKLQSKNPDAIPAVLIPRRKLFDSTALLDLISTSRRKSGASI